MACPHESGGIWALRVPPTHLQVSTKRLLDARSKLSSSSSLSLTSSPNPSSLERSTTAVSGVPLPSHSRVHLTALANWSRSTAPSPSPPFASRGRRGDRVHLLCASFRAISALLVHISSDMCLGLHRTVVRCLRAFNPTVLATDPNRASVGDTGRSFRREACLLQRGYKPPSQPRGLSFTSFPTQVQLSSHFRIPPTALCIVEYRIIYFCNLSHLLFLRARTFNRLRGLMT